MVKAASIDESAAVWSYLANLSFLTSLKILEVLQKE